MAQAWSILPLPRSKTLPLLLVKCQFENAAYTIHLTDLTYVWSETLDRRQIIRRALNDDTSIDPSEDAGQLKILLKKLEEALQGEQQTSLELESDVKDKSLLLNAVAPLPAPLRPLTWAIHLEPSSQETVTSELVLPSLNVQLMQRCQVSALLGQIKEKDHVIGRLLDKLESSGVELNSVFPGTAGYKHGKKGSERANAAKYVKGLGAFDEEQWSNETARSKPPVASQQELVQEVFKTREMETLPKTDSIAYVEPLRSWWTTLNNRPNSSTRSMVNGRVAFSAGHGDSTMDENRTSQLSDKYGDGFQVSYKPSGIQALATYS